jgi:hypothetical protein
MSSITIYFLIVIATNGLTCLSFIEFDLLALLQILGQAGDAFSGSGGGTDMGGGHNTSDLLRNRYSMLLANLTHTINFKFESLKISNISFESYFEQATEYKALGNVEM